jgi:peroxiredoxin
MKPLLRFLACLAVGSLLLANASAAPLPKAPAWTLNDLQGKPVHLSDYAGKVVVLNFWATWCPPCAMEIPGFIDLQKKNAARGLVIVGVSLDEGGPAVVRDFAARNHLNYPLVMATPEMLAAYGVGEGIPATFLIDPAGKLVKTFPLGIVEEKELQKAIAPLLPKAK